MRVLDGAGCRISSCSKAAAPASFREFRRLCTTVHVRSGRVLCRQGELGQECFVVVEGRADVFIDITRVATVGTGELIGELALLAQRACRTATVVATTDMPLLVLTRQEFASLAESSPGVLQRVLRERTRRLVEFNPTLRGALDDREIIDHPSRQDEVDLIGLLSNPSRLTTRVDDPQFRGR